MVKAQQCSDMNIAQVQTLLGHGQHQPVNWGLKIAGPQYVEGLRPLLTSYEARRIPMPCSTLKTVMYFWAIALPRPSRVSRGCHLAESRLLRTQSHISMVEREGATGTLIPGLERARGI